MTTPEWHERKKELSKAILLAIENHKRQTGITCIKVTELERRLPNFGKDQIWTALHEQVANGSVIKALTYGYFYLRKHSCF
jgi:hypothetical protein